MPLICAGGGARNTNCYPRIIDIVTKMYLGRQRECSSSEQAKKQKPMVTSLTAFPVGGEK